MIASPTFLAHGFVGQKFFPMFQVEDPFLPDEFSTFINSVKEPEAVFLRPFAITGVVGLSFPARSSSVFVDPDAGETEIERRPVTLTWAFSIQYSLIYL